MHHDQALRYARNISLPEIGESGQTKLLQSRILVIGAGGLGTPLLLYLAAAGIGTLGIVDDDHVALSNLQRQILYETSDIDAPKVNAAAEALHDLNPDITIHPHHTRLDASNIDALFADYDLIADGSDNVDTRFLINQKCLKHRKPLVSAAIMGFFGQLYTFKPYLGAPHPCYQCLYPQKPSADALPTCSESGILGSVAGIMGSLQATEIIKELLNIGDSLSGHMLTLDALSTTIRKVALPRDPACECCGENFSPRPPLV